MIKFADDIEAKVDAYYVQRTYLDWLEGKYERINARILGSVTTRIESIWGERPVLLLEPSLVRVAAPREDERLPWWFHCAWLTSEPTERDHMYSELVIVWFADAALEKSISESLQSAVAAVHWRSHAKDCDI